MKQTKQLPATKADEKNPYTMYRVLLLPCNPLSLRRMKKAIFVTRLALSLTAVFLFSSCENEEDDTPAGNLLTGRWVNTVEANPDGYYTDELIFNDDASFTEKSNSYGIYDGQDDDELSGWYERTGTYQITGDQLSFVSDKVVSWDSFFGGDPVTRYETREIFEGCTFRISNNTLEITYIIYPADAPENTTRQYQKQND